MGVADEVQSVNFVASYSCALVVVAHIVAVCLLFLLCAKFKAKKKLHACDRRSYAAVGVLWRWQHYYLIAWGQRL